MKITITTKTLKIERDIYRYGITIDNMNATLKDGRLETVPKNEEICTVNIEDETNGNITKTCQFVSYNFVVYDDPQTGKVGVIGDNTVLLKILDI